MKTTISISGDNFLINGQLTLAGRTHAGMSLQGLLPNSRMVQGIFDDLNPQTRSMWAYPDGPWDPDRNTREFLAAMPDWRAHGLLAFTINLQGGSPQGYSQLQPWHNSAFEPDGSLRMDYMRRLASILVRADELGMAVIVGYFYFGQDERLTDEAAVIRATDAATDWLLDHACTNVLVEIANEVDVPLYEHAILCPERCHELIQRVQNRSAGKVASPAGRLLASTSTAGGTMPPANLLAASDFVLIHGNGVHQPDGIRSLVDRVRTAGGYRGQPVVFNEDDHFNFDAADNNMLAAFEKHASWGFFDYRLQGEGFDEGYQSVPTNWGISSARKRGFFNLLAQVTGSRPGSISEPGRN